MRRASSSVAGTTFRSLNPFLVTLASGRTVKVKWKVFDTCNHKRNRPDNGDYNLNKVEVARRKSATDNDCVLYRVHFCRD